jgi:hypothetical protein
MAVQSRMTGGASVNSISLAFSSSVTAGNLIVVAISAYNFSTNGDTFTVTDSLSNTYHQIGVTYHTAWDQANLLAVFYAYNISGGACTVTVNPSGTDAAYVRFAIHEFTGIRTSPDPFDQTNRGQANSGTAVNSGNITTTSASELIFGAMNTYYSRTITEGANFTKLQENEDASIMTIGTEERDVTSTGTYAANWTLNSSDVWWAIVASFVKAAPASGQPIIMRCGNIPGMRVWCQRCGG